MVIWLFGSLRISYKMIKHLLNNDKILITISWKIKFWRDLRRSWGSLGGHSERCCLEVGLSWLMSELCCDIFERKMAAKIAIWGGLRGNMIPTQVYVMMMFLLRYFLLVLWFVVIASYRILILHAYWPSFLFFLALSPCDLALLLLCLACLFVFCYCVSVGEVLLCTTV